MKWWPWRRPVKSDEADDAKRQAERAHRDAEAFARRANAVGQQADRIRQRNHIAEAMELAIRVRGQNR